jgi:hypothetical protein
MAFQDQRVGSHQRKNPFLAIKAAYKENRFRFTHVLFRTEQLHVHTVKGDMRLSGQKRRLWSERATQVRAADDHCIENRRQSVEHGRAPMAEVIVLQVDDHHSSKPQLTNNVRPLGPVVDVDYVKPP